jgi:diacylglycerol kinase (ATP)
MRVAVIVNPERATELDELLEGLGRHDVDVVEAESFDVLAETVDKVVADGANVVAAVGGDGTQRIVGARLAGTGATLGVVPGGTVNLLAKVLGIDGFSSAAAAIDGDCRRMFDVGRCGDETFLLCGSMGYDADVVATVPEGTRRRFGVLAYVTNGLRRLRDRPREVVITADGEERFRGRAMSVLVMNVGQRGSAAFKLGQEAEPDDGRFDVVVMRAAGVWPMVRTMAKLALGRQPSDDDQIEFPAEKVTVSWGEPVRLQLDGDEAASASEFEFELRPWSLPVCCLRPVSSRDRASGG